MTLTRVAIPSPNYSSRGGVAVRLVVLHTAEGSRNFRDLGAYFQNPASQVSSHVGIDDTPGTIGEYVPAVPGKAWTQANANPYSVAAELCAFAAWDSAEWSRHPTMIANAGAWVAEECARFGIGVVALSSAQAQDGRSRGVCQHVNLGAAGGGHTDCGPQFPMAQVIAAAQGAPTPPTPTPPEEADMPAPVVFAMPDGSQQQFFVNPAGQLIHNYWTPGRSWAGEGLSTGWEPKAGLTPATTPDGSTYQVWGLLAGGAKSVVCWWSGKAWVTQPIP